MSELLDHGPRPMEAKPAVVELDPKRVLDKEDFATQADYVAMSVASGADAEAGKHEAYVEWVANEPHPELKKFARLMVFAPDAMAAAETISELLEHEKQSALLPSEAEALAKAKKGSCEFNHLLYELIVEHEEQLPKIKLKAWLTRASGGDEVWAGKIVAGAAAEVAAGKELAKVPGLTGLRHSTVAEDLEGRDFVFDVTPSGDWFVDIKTGDDRPEQPVTRNDQFGHIELNVRGGHLDRTGYAVGPDLANGYVDELTKALMTPKS